MKFIKTTIIGGLVFLVPVVVLVVVIKEAAGVMMAVAEPMADVIPMDSVAGVAMANIVAGVILVIISFLAGILARTAPAKKFAAKTENAVLKKLPGYAMIKGVASTLSPEQQSEMRPVLVKLDDRERIGLEIEKIDDGRVAVYFPGSPNAWVGTVEILSAERIETIDAPMTAVIDHAELLGKGTGKLLSR